MERTRKRLNACGMTPSSCRYDCRSADTPICERARAKWKRLKKRGTAPSLGPHDVRLADARACGWVRMGKGAPAGQMP